ncbi:efflux RND transporter periplasmic adaptor subunit [Haliea sp. E17]|uniref:efflux RND transporter periplasmic adaptor subunit n=1 Tax=Haliea sp. E17 TaxID=3401576 RepID=UPI003AABF47E
MHNWKIVTVAMLLPLAIAGCDRGSQEKTAGPSADTAVVLAADQVGTVATRTVNPTFELTGITAAYQSARVKPQVQARLLANHFAGGEQVAEGQLLVELDPASFEASLAAAKAQLESAQAASTQAVANWKRAEELKPDGFISELDYDQAKASFSSAGAAVSEAEAALQKAQLNLDRTRIVAPFSGRISPPGHAVGDLVGPLSVNPLFELVQLDPMYVDGAVEQGKYNHFVLLRKKLDAEGVDVPELKVSIQLTGGEEYPYSGKFQSWDHSAKAAPGMIVGRTLFPNPDQILLPGQNVIVRGEAIEAVTAVFVPQRAVLQDQQGHYVIAVGDDGVLVRRNIEVGIRDGADWSVYKGLEEGDRVVVRGADRLAPGTRVRIVDDTQ